ncbi:MAG: type 11 methyltransferase [Parcubacteria group bacterium Gr01-1014_8]|nr:MAG: type 11 methyltransferase [Parcubacteria group bacterium Gr01-1014_8]
MSEKAALFDVRYFFKRWPNFYYAVAYVFGPVLFTGLGAKKFLRRYPTTGSILNLGSGPRILGSGVTNVDIESYPGVSILADVCAVPLPDGSVSRIVSDNVLEHVKDPIAAVKEMERLLESNGLAYVCIPFLYPFHFSPYDYQRWTVGGYRELFKNFEIIEVGVRSGPFSALCAFLCHFTGTLFSFGTPTLNSLITNVSMFIFFPIKYLDIVFAHIPEAHAVAAVLYCVVRKR